MRREILSRFCFHKADDAAKVAMREVRIKVRELAALIDVVAPESREKATALTNLATVMMNANSAIVQQCPVDETDLTDKEREELLD